MTKEKKNDVDLKIILYLFKLLEPNKNFTAVIFILNFIVTLLNASGGYFVKNILDIVSRNRYDKFPFFIFSLIEIILIGIIIRYWLQYIINNYNNNILKNFRKKIMNKISELSYSFIENEHTSITMSKLLNDTSILQNSINDLTFTVINQLIMFIIVSIYLMYLNFTLFIIVLMCSPTIYLIKNLSKPITVFVQEKAKALEKYYAAIQDALSGIHIIKAYNLQNVIYEKFGFTTDLIYDAELKRQKRLAQLIPIMDIIPLLPFLSILTFGGYLVMRTDLTIGEFFAFIFMLKFLLGPINYLPEFITNLRETSVSINRIKSFFDSPVEKKEGQIFKIFNKKPFVEFKDVTFSYNDNQIILNSVNFSINKNQSIALVGPSGSGKSTIFKLICNFYQIKSGEIKLFGHNINKWELQYLRKNISIVNQSTYLFPASIAENIKVGKENASFDEIVESAKMANAHEFIIKLPDQYDTLIGDGSIKLSGGQCQRLSMARALLKDSSILLLDEPTSSLDSESEKQIQMALEKIKGKKTIIIIAHRLSTIMNVDNIFVLYQGNIVEEGTHIELFKKNGIYNRLYLTQFN